MSLAKAIARRKDDLLTELLEFCRIPSVSTDKEAIDEAVEFVVKAATSRGFARKHVESPGNPMLYFECPGKDDAAATLLYYCHYDVVPEGSRESWSVDPFAGEIRDGKLYCRGVSDHKASMLARIQAVGIVQELVGHLPVTAKMIAEGEEEMGSPYLQQVVEDNLDLLRADACLYSGWYRNEFDQVRINGGSRGTVSVELYCQVAEKNLHGAFATLVPDPAIRLAMAVSALFDSEMTCRLPGFYDSLSTITDQDREALKHIPFDRDTFKAELGVHRTVPLQDRMSVVERHVFHPTVTIGEFERSGKRGVVPAWARAELSFRLSPGMSPESIVHSVRDHLEGNGLNDIEVRPTGRVGRPSRIPVDHWLMEEVRQSGRRVFGVDPVVYPISSGSGPRYIFIDRGIPTMANIGAGHAGSNDHGPDENIRVEDYFRCVEHEADLLLSGLKSCPHRVQHS